MSWFRIETILTNENGKKKGKEERGEEATADAVDVASDLTNNKT